MALSLVESLYQGLHDANICVDDVPLRDVVAMSMPDGWTAIDTARIETRAEEAVALAHEFGHHKTDSFYNNYSGFDVRAKHEYTALCIKFFRMHVCTFLPHCIFACFAYV